MLAIYVLELNPNKTAPFLKIAKTHDLTRVGKPCARTAGEGGDNEQTIFHQSSFL